MKRIIFTVGMMALIVAACNDGNSKQVDDRKDETIQKKEQHINSDIVYLDTAKSIQNILCQDWVLEDDADALEGMDENSAFEIPYRSFSFSTKGSFIKNWRSTFDYGTWVYDDASKTITLNNTIDKTKDIYKIARVAFDELVLVNTGVNSNTNLKFIGAGLRYKNAEDEPFYLENNRWRIKPIQKETEQQVHQRLKDNLHFFLLFYKSVLAKDEKSVSFWGLPSCFKWYGGGIFIKKEKELKENWINCFYNKEQAMQAYQIAEKLMDIKYTWPKGEQNWLKLNLAVLEQMYKKIDDIH
ncbi:MAG: hypothetical protein JST34_01920 [Bacteroidetes bacterium]|nr:hypothetical protein [Bacteroidota bacterium]